MSVAALMQNNSISEGSQMTSASPTEFDYTFTDKELQEILGFMEHQAGGPDAAPTQAPPPFLSVPAQAGLSLQFQPHPIPVQSGSTLAAPPFDQSGVGLKGEPSSSSTGYTHLYPSHNGAALSRVNTGSRSSNFAPASSSQLAPDRRPSLQQIQGTAAPKQDREPKQHISHSTVEKQRRDRINSLIDEVHVIALQQGSALDLVTGCPPMQLRDLVPPSAANNAQQDGFDNKRPKHVVLSDTIALVKELQDKARLGEVNQPLKQEDNAHALMQRSYPEVSTSRSSDQSGSPRAHSAPDLPLAPEGAPLSSGVVVEQGESCLYVKVNCKDRRGLLGDIIMALKAMPLEITTAAITTTQDGNVYDVFQVRLDKEHAAWTAQDVQCQVHSNLYSNLLSNSGEKRRRGLGM